MRKLISIIIAIALVMGTVPSFAYTKAMAKLGQSPTLRPMAAALRPAASAVSSFAMDAERRRQDFITAVDAVNVENGAKLVRAFKKLQKWPAAIEAAKASGISVRKFIERFVEVLIEDAKIKAQQDKDQTTITASDIAKFFKAIEIAQADLKRYFGISIAIPYYCVQEMDETNRATWCAMSLDRAAVFYITFLTPRNITKELQTAAPHEIGHALLFDGYEIESDTAEDIDILMYRYLYKGQKTNKIFIGLTIDAPPVSGARPDSLFLPKHIGKYAAEILCEKVGYELYGINALIDKCNEEYDELEKFLDDIDASKALPLRLVNDFTDEILWLACQQAERELAGLKTDRIEKAARHFLSLLPQHLSAYLEFVRELKSLFNNAQIKSKKLRTSNVSKSLPSIKASLSRQPVLQTADITTPQLVKAFEAFNAGKLNEKRYFDLFCPQAPHGGSFMVTAGLEIALADIRKRHFTKAHIDALRKLNYFSEDFLEYLENFNFSGDIDAVAEGRVISRDIPIMRLKASLVEMALLEDLIKNRISISISVATKMARIIEAAKTDGKIRSAVDFSLRRAPGEANTLVSRAAMIGGALATSNDKAGALYNVPITGTLAHFLMQMFGPEFEIEAFRLYADAFPQGCIFLIDTYDTLEGAKKAAIVAKEMEQRGERLFGVRIDSGDLVDLSKKVRKILDDAGLSYVKIFASDDLDEWKIQELINKGACVDAFGVGTNLIARGEQPVLSLEIRPSDCERIFRISKDGKFLRFVNLPKECDTVKADLDEDIEELLKPFWRDGKRIAEFVPVMKARERGIEDLNSMDVCYKRLESAEALPVENWQNSLIVNPETDALLVVDAQPTFMPDGGLAVTGGDEIIPQTLQLMELFLKKNRFATRDLHPKGHVSLASSFAGLAPFTLLKYEDVADWTEDNNKIAPCAKFTLAQLKEYLKKVGAQMLWTDHAVEGTQESGLHPDLNEAKFEKIFIKGTDPAIDSYSAFFDNAGNPTGAAEELRKMGFKRIFIVGLAGDYCVKWSAEGAKKEGFDVFVVEDATRSVDGSEQTRDKIHASYKEEEISLVEKTELILQANRMVKSIPLAFHLPLTYYEHPEIPPEDDYTALTQDTYHLKMAQALFKAGLHKKEAVFDYFYRTPPYDDGYVIVSGIRFFLEDLKRFKFNEKVIAYLRSLKLFDEDFLKYLSEFEFKGDIYGLSEGSRANAREPIMVVTGNILEVMIIESLILNKINFNSLIATWANKALTKSREFLVEDGLAGAQGQSHLEASYSAFIGGINKTTNLDAHVQFGIPLAMPGEKNTVWFDANLVTGGPKSSLGGVYKLSEFESLPRIKLSDSPTKTTLPGNKTLVAIKPKAGYWPSFRVIALEGEQLVVSGHETIEMLHQPLVKAGEVVYQDKGPVTTRLLRAKDVDKFMYVKPTQISPGLNRLQSELINKAKQVRLAEAVAQAALRPMAERLCEKESLQQMIARIISECKNGNYESLQVKWHYRVLDWQEFIKQTAAINGAIKQILLYGESERKEFCDFSEFLRKAIGARIDMLMHYQAPLSEKGSRIIATTIEALEKKNFLAEDLKRLLSKLMYPSRDWVMRLLTPQKQAALKALQQAHGTPYVVATSGCSTHCDICDGASPKQIIFFSWAWLLELKINMPNLNLAAYKNDFLRDYYDFVFDADASDVMMLFKRYYINTSGFEPGSVAEKAFEWMLKNSTLKEVHISIVPSEWMRRIGVEKYIEYLNRIEDAALKSDVESYYEPFLFRRHSDPPDLMDALVKGFGLDSKPMMARLKTRSLYVGGRFWQLLHASLIDERSIMNMLVTADDVNSFVNEDIDEYFFLPDGQLIRGIRSVAEDDVYLRQYVRISDFPPVGAEHILCQHCDIECQGKNGCAGQKALFESRRVGILAIAQAALRPMAARDKLNSEPDEKQLDEFADTILASYGAYDKARLLLKVDDYNNIAFDLHELGFNLSRPEENVLNALIKSPSKSKNEILARQNMIKALINSEGFRFYTLMRQREDAYRFLNGIAWLCDKSKDVILALSDIAYNPHALSEKLKSGNADKHSKVYEAISDVLMYKDALTELIRELKEVDDPLMKRIVNKLESLASEFGDISADRILDVFQAGNSQDIHVIETQSADILGSLYEVGAFLSFADFAKKSEFSKAGFNEIEKEGYQQAWNFTRKKEKQKKNSITCDKAITAIFTGSNMSGKTSFLVQDLFIQLLGQAFGYIPAESGNLRIYKKIIFIDRVTAEKTHDLGAHGRDCKEKWKEALDIADSDTKIIVDEGYSATSPLDQTCLLDGSTNYLRQRKARFLVATHNEDYILQQIKKPDVDVYAFKVRIENGKVEFIYEIVKVGDDLSLIDSRALEIARTLGLREPVIKRAQAFLDGKERPVTSVGKKKIPQPVAYSDEERARLKKKAKSFMELLPMDNMLVVGKYGNLITKYKYDSRCDVYADLNMSSEERPYKDSRILKTFTENEEFNTHPCSSREVLIKRLLLTGTSNKPQEILERQKMFKELAADAELEKDSVLNIYNITKEFMEYLIALSIQSAEYYENINLHILIDAYEQVIKEYNLDWEDAQQFVDIVQHLLELNHISVDEAGIREYVERIKAIKFLSENWERYSEALEKHGSREGANKEFGMDLIAESERLTGQSVYTRGIAERPLKDQISNIVKVLFGMQNSLAPLRDSEHLRQILLGYSQEGFPKAMLLQPVSCLEEENLPILEDLLEKLRPTMQRMKQKRGRLGANFNHFIEIANRLKLLLDKEDPIERFTEFLKKYDSVHLHQIANYFESITRGLTRNVKNGREFFRRLKARKDKPYADVPMPCSGFQVYHIYPELEKLHAMFEFAKRIRDEQWSAVKFHDKLQLVVKKAWNPNLPKDKQTRNDASFDLSELIRIYSGSNKSGKSYSIRQLIWSIIAAQATGFAPNEGMVMPVFEVIAYLDRIGTTLNRNLSAFGSEAVSMESFFDFTDIDGLAFCAADEIGASTSPKYQSALSYAASEDKLASGDMFVLASHNHDFITRFEDKNKNHVKVYYFVTRIHENGEVEFDYEIKQGHVPSYGVEIAKLVGLDAVVSMIDPELLAIRNKANEMLCAIGSDTPYVNYKALAEIAQAA